MATLNLVKTDNGQYYLQGTGDPSRNADFSLYDWNGEGRDPFAFGNQEWELVRGIGGIEYDPDDYDSWWQAQEQILEAAKNAGIDVPGYACLDCGQRPATHRQPYRAVWLCKACFDVDMEEGQ